MAALDLYLPPLHYLFTMLLISLNVGKPRSYSYNGKEVVTSIFKSPVDGERKVTTLNIDGDEQGDLVVHGGVNKAVYAYDISYYDHWKKVLPRDDWSYGMFGENLTTDGLTDDVVGIGNVYRVGTVLLKAIQPRFPCTKLNVRFGRDDMIQQFMEQGRNGTYFKVVQEGSLQAGDAIELVEQSPHGVTVKEFVETYYSKGADRSTVERVLAIEFLPERMRKAFESFR